MRDDCLSSLLSSMNVVDVKVAAVALYLAEHAINHVNLKGWVKLTIGDDVFAIRYDHTPMFTSNIEGLSFAGEIVVTNDMIESYIKIARKYLERIIQEEDTTSFGQTMISNYLNNHCISDYFVDATPDMGKSLAKKMLTGFGIGRHTDMYSMALDLMKDKELDAFGIVQPLYESFYFNFTLSGKDFNPMVALIRIQVASGTWLAQHEIESPINSLRKGIFLHIDTKPELAKHVYDTANIAYESGGKKIAEALNSDNYNEFYGNLYISCSDFWVSMWIYKILKDFDKRLLGNIDYEYERAEEGQVISSTSLSCQLLKRYNGSFPNPYEEIKKNNYTKENAVTFLNDICRVTSPDIPRFIRDKYLNKIAAIGK